MVYCRRCLYPRRVLELEETIGQRVRKERWAKGMSQGQLAREASLSLNAISALEQGGRVDPRSSTILSISRALNVPVATLLVGEEAPKAAAPNSSDDEVRRVLELWAPFVDTANEEEVKTFTEAVMRCAQGDDRWAADTLVTMTSSAPTPLELLERAKENYDRVYEQLAAWRGRISSVPIQEMGGKRGLVSEEQALKALKELAEPKERDRWEETYERARQATQQLAALRAEISKSVFADKR